MCVNISQTFFLRLSTLFTTPLDPNTYAKLDRSSGIDDRYANKFAPLDSTVIYPKLGHALLYTPMIGEIESPTNIPLPCAFYSISSNVDATHAPTRSTMI
jgi:hypothetical protein